ncbi:coenzyme Q-binding protein COQ10 homolog B, mitochondrial [Bicyclus anynana]|uniref:Coenzyme Q-binding protein COQ10 homolog B, mitochondrial n=1 Tax=Bicyclus anynana TaxID=110368 RepID=A0A1C9EGN9_BICAN|nr:coenzyme Q-binding protein COQ10 homolog B, mitochondrial [Bicyclus anynana]AON96655.1 coenzyme Q-binding protein COQ10-like protein A, mitochondrial [Bicyclus anynana]
MVLSKIYSSGSRALFHEANILRCQGHYVNIAYCQCHTINQQRRTFFNFANSSRKREYSGRQLVGYTMEQMYNVVSDVENYHKFVPWCKKSIVLTKTPSNLKADLIVGFPPINESYTSNVTLIKPHLVKAECTDGKLFHYMLTLWRFSSGLKREHQSCVVDFQISFEFRSAFHSNLSNLFFDQVARQMEGAFVQEAGRRYGAASLPPRNLLQNGHVIKS